MVKRSAPAALDQDDGDSSIASSIASSADLSTSSLESETDLRTESSSPAEKEDEHDVLLAEDETTNVWLGKRLVAVMMLVTGALVVTSTYIFLNEQENNQFETAYNESAATIINRAEIVAAEMINDLFTLSDSITSDVMLVNETWPFATVPHFEIKGLHAHDDPRMEIVFLAPLVSATLLNEWEAYSVTHQHWLDESLELKGSAHMTENRTRGAQGHEERSVQGEVEWYKGDEHLDDHYMDAHDYGHPEFSEYVFSYDENGTITKDVDRPVYAPIWQLSPPPELGRPIVNYDMMADDALGPAIEAILESNGIPGLTQVKEFSFLFDAVFTKEEHVLYDSQGDPSDKQEGAYPHSVLLLPIMRNYDEKAEIVGIIATTIIWEFFFTKLLPNGIDGLYVVLENTCGQAFSYEIEGQRGDYLGQGDFHPPEYSSYRRTLRLNDVVKLSTEGEGHCEFTINVYPSPEFRVQYDSNKAAVFTASLAAAILATIIAFLVFAHIAQRRQLLVLETARKTNAIVSSMFPSNVRDRIMEDARQQAEAETRKKVGTFGGKFEVGAKQLKSFLNEDHPQGVEEYAFGSKPIADLFPAVTIMFADMVGFTAWSSVREPFQVFMLLETVYQAFDQIAKRRRVYKVETVGDCYVAVAGLPDPRKDHAVIMARFACECGCKMKALTKVLEQRLGPETADLSVRIGLHSGPVTAGVLRGERSRFQLFGDTMNTAARIESSGEASRVHISQETAKLIRAAGKGHWVTERENKILIKGKGELQTFWLDLRKSHLSSSHSGSGGHSDDTALESYDEEIDVGAEAGLNERMSRLTSWNSDLLVKLLKEIVARRQARGGPKAGSSSFQLPQSDKIGVLDEVKEVIMLPAFDAESVKKQIDPANVELSAEVESEAKDYVATVAMLYRNNAFHNFEHAAHVTMSVSKLLSRIVAPSDFEIEDGENDQVASTLHDHTYGITSDPLTQFACVFSALIHDVDHTGVPNVQLIKEGAQIAAIYGNKSIAEQNSVDIAWNLLTDPRFENFFKSICATQDEFNRFRELVVNCVLATDIMDKELKALRNSRWEKAFKEADDNRDTENVNRKATIVIEHLLQASDVAHTMQHWEIFRKWNERLFDEMYTAFKDGRAEKDPAEFWYKGEMGFFDFYILPLVKKLADCGVFGVSSFEYLHYAEQNRAEWEVRGMQIVEEMVSRRRRDGF